MRNNRLEVSFSTLRKTRCGEAVRSLAASAEKQIQSSCLLQSDTVNTANMTATPTSDRRGSGVQISASHGRPLLSSGRGGSDIPSISAAEGARKRQKVTRACDNCKARKRRCTGEQPCTNCLNNGGHCSYLSPYSRGKPVPPAPSVRSGLTSASRTQNDPKQAAYPPSWESGDEALSATEQEAPISKRHDRLVSPDVEATTLAGQYQAQSSGYSFLRRAWKRFGQDAVPGVVSSSHHDESTKEASVFACGDRPLPEAGNDDIRLPSSKTTNSLMSTYFEFAMPTYRFLHQGTICDWLERCHQEQNEQPDLEYLPPIQRAIVLTILATALLYTGKHNDTDSHDEEQATQDGEKLFQAAQRIMASETGRLKLESVQARLATCLYLLSTSRPSQAWFMFGTTVQVAMALGLHRSSVGAGPQADYITKECQKRAFWGMNIWLSIQLNSDAHVW